MGLLSRAVQRGVRAMHASPHDFEKFDISRIGTGEGSQAFAHGLYFTGDDAINQYYRQFFASRGATPRTYEVNLNVSPDDLADWDAPIAQQPRRIQDAFAELYEMPRSRLMDGQKPQPKGARESARLREMGIPGVVYDAGSFWGGSPEGARNYVMFDDGIIDILRKYGIAGLTAGGGGGLLSAAQRRNGAQA